MNLHAFSKYNRGNIAGYTASEKINIIKSNKTDSLFIYVFIKKNPLQ